jgi:dihydrofolate synthase / folylpolyglutamate synthase
LSSDSSTTYDPPRSDAPLADWLAHAERTHTDDIKLGLERSAAVAEELELLPCAKRTVLVGGTNGKGSVATYIAEILGLREQRVGTYLSPHLWDFNERVRIAGQPVSNDWLSEAFAAVESARDGIPLTYFEFCTLASMWCFREAVLDVAVLEVGMGGRLDATNIVQPDVSVITNIGLDHQEWLGFDRDSIALEKAGILRPGVHAIFGDRDPPPNLVERARASTARWLGRDFDAVPQADGWVYRDGDEWTLPMPTSPGQHQLDNAACAIAAAKRLMPDLSARTVGGALKTRLSGRCEVVAGHPLFMIDVGHNPDAARALATAVEQSAVPHPRIAVLGMLDDKDAAGYVNELAGVVDQWVAVDLPSPRASSALALVSVLQSRGLRVIARAGAPIDGLTAARTAAGADGTVLLLGSFLCAGAIPRAAIYSDA